VVKTILYKRSIALGTSIDFRKDLRISEPENVLERLGCRRRTDGEKQEVDFCDKMKHNEGNDQLFVKRMMYHVRGQVIVTTDEQRVLRDLEFRVSVCIGADFRFEVPGQSSVGLIGGGRGQWLGGHHGEYGARAYNGGLAAEPPAGSRGRAPGQGAKAP